MSKYIINLFFLLLLFSCETVETVEIDKAFSEIEDHLKQENYVAVIQGLENIFDNYEKKNWNYFHALELKGQAYFALEETPRPINFPI